MDDFGEGLKQLIEKTLAAKSEELSKREKEVTLREKRIEDVVKNVRKGHIQLRVGNCVFHTTCETLTRVKDSYFASGLLDTSMIDEGKLKEPIFIDRDGEVFKFVLEYLQYGEIFTPIPNDGFRRKLLADAKFYLLPELEEVVRIESGTVSECFYLSLSSQQSCSNQQYVVWNGQHTGRHLLSSQFTLSPDNARVTFSKAGLYQIHVRLAQTNSLNSQYLSLQLNGSDIAQCVQVDGGGYQNTAQITEILQIAQGNYIQVRCNANSGSLANNLQTRLTVVLLK